MVIMATLINLPSISIWAFGGSIIRYYLDKPRLKKVYRNFISIVTFSNISINCYIKNE